MNRIGSKENLIKEVMKLLGQVVTPTRIYEALSFIEEIKEYNYKNEVSVYFYYNDDDDLFLTENSSEVDFDAELIVEIQWSNNPKSKGFWGKTYNQ